MPTPIELPDSYMPDFNKEVTHTGKLKSDFSDLRYGQIIRVQEDERISTTGAPYESYIFVPLIGFISEQTYADTIAAIRVIPVNRTDTPLRSMSRAMFMQTPTSAGLAGFLNSFFPDIGYLWQTQPSAEAARKAGYEQYIYPRDSIPSVLMWDFRDARVMQDKARSSESTNMTRLYDREGVDASNLSLEIPSIRAARRRGRGAARGEPQMPPASVYREPMPTKKSAGKKRQRTDAEELTQLDVAVYTPSLMGELATRRRQFSELPDEFKDKFALDRFGELTHSTAKRNLLAAAADKNTWQRRSVAERAKYFFSALAAPYSDYPLGLDFYDYYYAMSMFCPKADPLGRYILCDVHVQRGQDNYDYFRDSYSYSGNNNVVLNYAGVQFGNDGSFVLGIGSPTTEEAEDYAKNEDMIARSYMRMHSPQGVRLQMVGLGTVLYGATAVAANFGERFDGTYSNARSESADRWWERALASGLAVKSKQIKYREVNARRIQGKLCRDMPAGEELYVNSEDEDLLYRSVEELRKDFPDVDPDFINKTTNKVCTTVSTKFGPYREPARYSDKVDLLPAENVLATNLIPFIARHNIPGTRTEPNPYQKTSWNPVDVESKPNSIMSETCESLFKRGNSSETQAELLARASFGPSPRLALAILETLNQSGRPELAKQYLARTDIAALIASNKTALGILRQRALPSFGRMSSRLAGYVLSGLSEGIEANTSPENPLNIPPMPASISRKLDVLAFDS